KYEQEADGAEGEEGTGEDGQNVPDDAKPLEGVEFTITQTHSFDPSTDIWTEISNGEVFTGVTDASGQYTFYDLPLGRYNVEETDAPPHVNMYDGEIVVDLPMTTADGENLIYDV